MTDKVRSPSSSGSTLSQLFNKIKPGRKRSVNAETADTGDDSISLPTAVQHNFHCGIDATTNEITGLPPSWMAWLAASKIR